ncbi:hypothetical protein F3Y22_tig00110429pilonHSYRG01282 [Hibiscus syriacus]|uniref:Bet v I/Major latex protein domain-containing protein n=1 Tax=Hibiscus syriacus TaxID=106335 RepID=A0A6A3ARH8_HIBSY|nr:hypothetical protein F3Y22_tig00110429pilonHSYRG01282 [Hibiscus syriacus]
MPRLRCSIRCSCINHIMSPAPALTMFEHEIYITLSGGKEGSIICWAYFLATPSAKGKGCVVQWVLEYEKLKEDIALPETTLAMLLEVATDMGAHLTKP